jgi:hypothetical protein
MAINKAEDKKKDLPKDFFKDRPTPVIIENSNETIFTYPVREIYDFLRRKSAHEIKIREQFKTEFDHLANSVQTAVDAKEYILQNIQLAKYIYTNLDFVNYGIETLQMGSNFKWQFKIRIKQELKTVFHCYRLHFAYCPLWYYAEIERIKNKREEVEKHPTLPLEIADGDEAEQERDDIRILEGLRKQEADAKKRFKEETEKHTDIVFFGNTQKSEYKPGDFEDDTVIYFDIPKEVVSELNDKGEDLIKYQLRNEAIIIEE